MRGWKRGVTAEIPKPLAALGMRQKQVVDHLRAAATACSPAEIAGATGRDVASELDLRDALENNPKVGIDDDGRYFYRPDANVRSKMELLNYVRKAAAPVAVIEIADAYKTVMEDVEVGGEQARQHFVCWSMWIRMLSWINDTHTHGPSTCRL